MKEHLRNTLEKLRVRTRAQAAAFAIQAGLVSLEQLMSADTTASSRQAAGRRQSPVQKPGGKASSLRSGRDQPCGGVRRGQRRAAGAE